MVVLTINLLVAFMANAVLVVAIPTFGRDLHASVGQLQWIQAGNSIAFAALMLIGGTLAHVFGPRQTIRVGLLCYLVGAVVAALSHDPNLTIACRGLMGTGGALLMPSTLSLLVQVMAPGQRAKAIAIWTSFTGVTGGLGPVLSGLLLGHFWFGVVFLINIPFIVAGLIGAQFVLPNIGKAKERAVDFPGAGLSLITIGLLVFTIIRAPKAGWLSPQTLILFGVVLVGLLAFLAWERVAPAPMMPLGMFRIPSFSGGFVGMLIVFLTYYGVGYVGTLWLQVVNGYTALHAAYAMTPYVIIVLFGTPYAPRLAERIGMKFAVSFGVACCATGFALLGMLQPGKSYIWFGGPLAVYSLGMAIVVPLMTQSMMAAVHPHRSGTAAAMNNLTRELGQALGVAIIGSVSASVYAAGLVGTNVSSVLGVDATGAPAAAVAAAEGSQDGAITHAAEVVRMAFSHGTIAAVLGAGAFCLVGLIVALIYIPRRVTQRDETEPDDGPQLAENELGESEERGAALPLRADLRGAES